MEDLVVGDLTVAVSTSDAIIICRWTGRSVEREAELALEPFFDNLLEAAGETRSIDMHFEALAHFNSSTISTLIVFIQAARRKKVPLTLHYDESLKWQRLSFDALRMFQRNDELFSLTATTNE